ncbi:hypothetical protein GCM10023259_052440 [Thermocatellispora tengchongensis]
MPVPLPVPRLGLVRCAAGAAGGGWVWCATPPLQSTSTDQGHRYHRHHASALSPSTDPIPAGNAAAPPTNLNPPPADNATHRIARSTAAAPRTITDYGPQGWLIDGKSRVAVSPFGRRRPEGVAFP